MKRIICFLLIPAFIFTLNINVSARVITENNQAPIYNQDGNSFSQMVIPKSIGGDISQNYFRDWPEGITATDRAFSSIVYDGVNFYLVPQNETKIVKVDPNGNMTALTFPEGISLGDTAFSAGVFDGANIYFAPYNANAIVKLNTQNDEITLINNWPEGFDKDSHKFTSAVFDGEAVWFIPREGSKILKLKNDALEVVDTWPDNTPPVAGGYSSSVFDGENIWLIPYNDTRVIKIDKDSNEMTSYTDWPEGFDSSKAEKFKSGTAVGRYIFLAPYKAEAVVRINKQTGDMAAYRDFPEGSGTSFSVVGTDGRKLWMAPVDSEDLVVFDTEYNLMKKVTLTNANSPNGTDKYSGAVFDGADMWFSPFSTGNVLKISGDNTAPVALYLEIETTKNTPVQSTLTVIDPDEGDNITFELVTNPGMGTVDLNPETGDFTYTPNQDVTGVDSFAFKANDGTEDSNVTNVVVTIKEGGEPSIPAERGLYIDLWGHWAEEAANNMTNANIFLGEKVGEDYYFYPNRVMNRAEFLVFANSVLGVSGSETDYDLPFEDTKEGAEAWVIKTASGSYRNNVIKGSLEDGKLYFKPYDSLTRIEAITIAYNMIGGVEAAAQELTFADNNQIPEWAREIVGKMLTTGLVNGYDDNTLRPNQTVTRAEAIQLFYNLVEYIAGPGNVDNLNDLMLK